MRALIFLLFVIASPILLADCRESDVSGDFALTLTPTIPNTPSDVLTGIVVFDGAGKVEVKQLRVPTGSNDGETYYVFKGYGRGQYGINAVCTGFIKFTVRDQAERQAVAQVTAQILLAGSRSAPTITGSAIVEDTYAEERNVPYEEDLFPKAIPFENQGSASISLTPINF